MKYAALIAGLLGVSSSAGFAQQVSTGVGADIRALDRITGESRDLVVKTGETIDYERLEITLKECRYPSDSVNSDAFAHVIIKDKREEKPRFSGWMIASSPALSALDHPRYDVWVLNCTA